MGVPLQFRVTAFNNGGQSLFSEESAICCPGEANVSQIPSGVRWRRLTQGGPFSILDYLFTVPKVRLEQIRGFHKLLAFAQYSNGFNKAGIQMKVAKWCLHILKTFVNDVELGMLCFSNNQSLILTVDLITFNTEGFLSIELLGYCIVSSNDKNNEIKQFLIGEGITDISQRLLTSLREDSRLMKSMSWLRSKLPDVIPETPPMPERKEHKNEKGDDEDDDEDEDDP
jgi:hypothetical protein